MQRAGFFKIIAFMVALTLTVPTTARARSLVGLHAKSLADTRWSGFADCSRSFINLKADGTTSMANGATGTWRMNGDAADITIGGFRARMMAEGPFTIGDRTLNVPGSRWEQCHPQLAIAYLPKAWLDETRWTESRNCNQTLKFHKDGSISSNYGLSGTWKTGDVGIITMLMNQGEMGDYYFRRSGSNLVSAAYSLRPC